MATQLTLEGEETDAERIRPSTFRWCDECEEAVFIGEDHEHDLSGAMAYEKARVQELEEKVPSEAKVETRTYVVDFHYNAVERVVVEARDERDAKREAKHHRTYDAEIQDPVHTDKPWTTEEPSPASIEYLENNGLLSEDHDVTQGDIDQLVEGVE